MLKLRRETGLGHFVTIHDVDVVIGDGVLYHSGGLFFFLVGFFFLLNGYIEHRAKVIDFGLGGVVLQARGLVGGCLLGVFLLEDKALLEALEGVLIGRCKDLLELEEMGLASIELLLDFVAFHFFFFILR